jgi:hypothetical protein
MAELSRFTVRPNQCSCHPETCGCNPWAVFIDGRKDLTFFHEQDATIYALTMKLEHLQQEAELLARAVAERRKGGRE